MKSKLVRIAKDTNLFLKKFIKKDRIFNIGNKDKIILVSNKRIQK